MLLSDDKIKHLTDRWEGQAERLNKIADSIVRGEDWTVHLEGLPYLDEIEMCTGDKFPRDLRGANLRRYLQPTTVIEPATLDDTPNIAYIIKEAMLNDTPLRGVSPFPVPHLTADDIGLAMEQGSRFFMAMQLEKVIGALQLDSGIDLKHCTEDEPYYEVTNICTLPAYRHQGVGGAIIRETEKFAREEGKHEWILMRTIAELGFESYYERIGYRRKEVSEQRSTLKSPAYIECVLVKHL
jgi:ribosomal protein S18 acetylase RimI-like enzyme